MPETTDPVDAREAILHEVRRGLDGDPKAELAVEFATAAIRRLPDEQLKAVDLEPTSVALIDAFRFADDRRRSALSLRVFTPELGSDGAGGSGTVVEVATDDRPFLLTTVLSELSARGLTVMRTLHPILGVERDAAGNMTDIHPARTADRRESFVHVELEEALSADEANDLRASLRRHLHDLIAATRDYEAMRDRVAQVADELRQGAGPRGDAKEVEEVAALLDWLLDDNFVLLGAREYEVVTMQAEGTSGPVRAVRVRPGSGLGILSDEETSSFAEPTPLDELDQDLRDRILGAELLTVSRTNRFATVHRRTRMVYVGVKRLKQDGTGFGEFRVLGLLTRKGTAEPARTTPILREKLRHILEAEDVVPGSHDESTLRALFHAVPKDELFQADVETLRETLRGLFYAEEHQRVQVVTRHDPFTRTVSILVAVPRDHYSPLLRRELQSLFMERYGATSVEVDVSLGDRTEALARFSLRLPSGATPDVQLDELQREVRALARSWVDDVAAALVAGHGEAEGTRLARRYANRFPRSYRDATAVGRAVEDVQALDRLVETGRGLAVRLQPDDDQDGTVRLEALRQGEPLVLSKFLPILESLGLTVTEEVPHHLEGEGPDLFIHDFGIRDARGGSIDVDRDGQRLADATLAAWNGLLEIDSLNGLVLSARLEWRQISVLRAYRRYRRQVGTAYTPEYVNEALNLHPNVVRALIDLFEARFDPVEEHGEDELTELRHRVIDACDEVARLDHDRIMRSFLALIEATLRTNALLMPARTELAAGERVPYLAFKLASDRVPDVPKPVPYREIFVYSPMVEGIHLRGGPVARGGMRWSDRMDDVRTEVLGLMKAQVLKNAVIVPTGAKGGFVVKRPPGDPDALRREVRRQYETFVRGLLDLTDNLVGGEVVPPEGIRRHDGDDPYLVVAADRGTATFSDLANSIAKEYGFWLGDAFASGGSRGYDHKALGITARGAWVAVQRHFRELGVDTQTEPIRVAGIGDMSGDVFGNGMLSSRSIQLVAAFDHRDIFLDPDPDPTAAFEERQRLFRLPSSSWQDYDRDLISEGGGVYSRSLKRIELSRQVRDVLRIDDEALSPAELISAILAAPVDLLFAGGIGTYVRSTEESDDEIGDRANDEVRIEARDLRARVYGEGANLSITQLARIQYARRGGRINQDAIDNAGGVDISDHEVNVKILLGLAREDGNIDEEERDRLLEAVTGDVVAHVLRDVDLQAWRLSQEVVDSPRLMDAYESLMQRLESDAGLDRVVEALPGPDEMADRAEAGAGLTRPELATLLGFVKRALATHIVRSGLVERPSMQPTLASYFPETLVERFRDLLPRHRLRPDLIAMIVANDLVNRLGLTFAYRLEDETGAPLESVVGAYWAAREVTGADRYWRALEDLDQLLGSERQLDLKRRIDTLVAEMTRRYLTDPAMPDVGRIVDRDRAWFATLQGELMEIGTSSQRSQRVELAQRLMDDLVEEELARYLASTREMAIAPDVAVVARAVDKQLGAAAAIADAFLRLGSELAIDRLQRLLTRMEPETRWARWQHGGLAGDLRALLADAVARALRDEPDLAEPEAVASLLRRREQPLQHALSTIREIEIAEDVGLDAVAVATRTMRDAILTDH